LGCGCFHGLVQIPSGLLGTWLGRHRTARTDYVLALAVAGTLTFVLLCAVLGPAEAAVGAWPLWAELMARVALTLAAYVWLNRRLRTPPSAKGGSASAPGRPGGREPGPPGGARSAPPGWAASLPGRHTRRDDRTCHPACSGTSEDAAPAGSGSGMRRATTAPAASPAVASSAATRNGSKECSAGANPTP